MPKRRTNPVFRFATKTKSYRTASQLGRVLFKAAKTPLHEAGFADIERRVYSALPSPDFDEEGNQLDSDGAVIGKKKRRPAENGHEKFLKFLAQKP